MRLPKSNKLIPVGARLDEELIKEASKKMKVDKRKGFNITWRKLFESGIKDYLEEKTLPLKRSL